MTDLKIGTTTWSRYKLKVSVALQGVGNGTTACTFYPNLAIRIKMLIELRINLKIMNDKNKKRIVFYLDMNDKILLNNQCELLKINASFFIRNCVLEKLGKPVLEVKQNNLETKNYMLQLFNIGNNLNQIAKKLNSNLDLKVVDQASLKTDIDTIKTHISEVTKKLQ